MGNAPTVAKSAGPALKTGDIVQVVDPGHGWHACLLVVREALADRVVAYRMDTNGRAVHAVIPNGKVEWVGRAVLYLVPSDGEE